LSVDGIQLRSTVDEVIAPALSPAGAEGASVSPEESDVP
jgi:hypothetical protein